MPTTEELILELILKDQMSAQSKAARDAVNALTDAEKEAIVATHNQAEAMKAAGAAAEKNSAQQKSSVDMLKGSWTEFQSMMGTVDQISGKVQQGLKVTVGETVAYAAQIRELSRTIGSSAEESSILIQAADDVGIEFGTIQTAMESAIRKGFRPSIEGLAEIAEKANSIQDPIERTEFLLKTFGRAGADLAPLMALGAEGIREAGQAARDSGLVMTEEGVKAAREYEIAMDNLGDAAKGLQYAIGTELIPILVSAANAGVQLATWDKQLTNVLSEHEKEVKLTADSYQEYENEMLRAAVAAGKLTEAQAASVRAGAGVPGINSAHARVMEELSTRIGLVSEADFEQARASAALSAVLQDEGNKWGGVARAVEDTDAVKAKYSGILGTVTSLAIAYTVTEQQIADKERELASVNAELQTAWGGNVTKLQEQKVALEENIVAMQKTQEIERAKELFNAFSQALTAGKITEAEYTQATTELNSWTNLYSDSALRAAQQQTILVNMIAQGKVPIDEQVAALSGARESFDGFIFQQTAAGASAMTAAQGMREAAMASRDYGAANAQITAGAVPAEAGDRTERMVAQLNSAKKAAADFGAQAEAAQSPLVTMSDNALVAAGSLSEVKRVISEVGAVSADNSGLILNLSGALDKIPRNIPIVISITTVGGVPELPEAGTYYMGPQGASAAGNVVFAPGSIVVNGAAGQSAEAIAREVSIQVAARARAMSLARVAQVR